MESESKPKIPLLCANVPWSDWEADIIAYLMEDNLYVTLTTKVAERPADGDAKANFDMAYGKIFQYCKHEAKGLIKGTCDPLVAWDLLKK